MNKIIHVKCNVLRYVTLLHVRHASIITSFGNRFYSMRSCYLKSVTVMILWDTIT